MAKVAEKSADIATYTSMLTEAKQSVWHCYTANFAASAENSTLDVVTRVGVVFW